MSADIFTKAFSDPLKWRAVCELILVLDESRLSDTEFLTALLSTPPSLSGGVSKRSIALSSVPDPPNEMPSKPGWHVAKYRNPILVVKEPSTMKTPKAKLQDLAHHFDRRSTWILAQGSECWEKIEDGVPYWGRDNERRNLKPLLVKAIFEFSSSSKFEIPAELYTPVKQAPPAAKAKPGVESAIPTDTPIR